MIDLNVLQERAQAIVLREHQGYMVCLLADKSVCWIRTLAHESGHRECLGLMPNNSVDGYLSIATESVRLASEQDARLVQMLVVQKLNLPNRMHFTIRIPYVEPTTKHFRIAAKVVASIS